MNPDWLAKIGGVVWIAFVAWRRPDPLSAEWAEAIFLLAPLVLVPLTAPRGLSTNSIGFLCLAACWLAASFVTGSGGGFLWLWTPAFLRVRESPYLLVGAIWTLCWRSGYRPLGFDPVIVALTAIHFHYAGYLLPRFTARARATKPGTLSRWADLGVLAGVPIVAAAITATKLGLPAWLEAPAAVAMAGAAMLAAVSQWRAASLITNATARRLLAASSISLAAGALFAIAYGTRALQSVDPIDIPWMRALHGSLMAFGFGLCGALGWRLADSQGSSATRRST